MNRECWFRLGGALTRSTCLLRLAPSRTADRRPLRSAVVPVRWGGLLRTAVAWAACAALVGSAAATNLLVLVDTSELFVSGDGGEGWSVRAALPAPDAVALAAGNSSRELLLVTRTGQLYVSGDGGEVWSLQGCVSAPDVASMIVRSDGGILLLGGTGILWESADGGIAFAAVAGLPQSDWAAMTRTDAGALFAVARTGTVAQSLDGGQAWETVGSLTASDVVAIAAMGSELYVLTDTGSVWRSESDGADWAAVATLSQVHMRSLIHVRGAGLYAATSEGEVAHSADGEEWTWVGTVNQVHVMALASDQPSSGVEEPAGRRAGPRVTLCGPNPLPRSLGRLAFRVVTELAQEVRLEVFDAQGRCLLRGEGLHLPGGGEGGQVLSWPVQPRTAGVCHALIRGDGWVAAVRVVVVGD